MGRYRYDGSFEGYLSTLCLALAERDEAVEFVRDAPETEPGLFDGPAIAVVTDKGEAAAFRERFAAEVSPEAFSMLCYAFHSEREGIENLLWQYVRLGLQAGPWLCSMIADKRVNRVDRLARAVSREAHRYKGFVRFRELEEGFLYARIEPEAHIIRFLAPHFARRVGDRLWVIHDLRRSVAAVYDLAGWSLVHDITLTGSPRFTGAEEGWAGLWRSYFRRLAVEERRNPKLQQKLVPLRSRKYLVEFE